MPDDQTDAARIDQPGQPDYSDQPDPPDDDWDDFVPPDNPTTSPLDALYAAYPSVPDPWNDPSAPPLPRLPAFPSGAAPAGNGLGNRNPAGRRYTTISHDDLNGLPLPELDYVIDGIIPRGALVLFAGREKEGKSLAMLDAAVAVATGEPLGRPRHHPGGRHLRPGRGQPAHRPRSPAPADRGPAPRT